MKKILNAIVLIMFALAILTTVNAINSKDVRIIEATVMNEEYMIDTCGSEWYTGDNKVHAGDKVLLVFDMQGTATQTDDIMIEVRTAQ